MTPAPQSQLEQGRAHKLLNLTGVAWYVVALLGQLAFVAFILAFYARRTIAGDFAAWNDKPLIDGFKPGDDVGNMVFITHVLLAAVVTIAGLLQLVPAIRRRVPALHRWTGRVYVAVAIFLALGGVWLTLVRGTYLSGVSAAAILGDAALILIFSAMAWRRARRRDFDAHRRWAMRAFMAISGVWFLRVGLMGWVVLNQGTVGMNDTMSGPADVVLTFGSYLIPLAVLEMRFAAERSRHPAPALTAACVVLVSTLFMAVGVLGAVAFMWGPYMTV